MLASVRSHGAKPSLNLYRRHGSDCAGGRALHDRTYEPDELRRGWKKCFCPINASGTPDGQFRRKNIEAVAWTDTKAIVAEWRRACSWDGTVDVVIPPGSVPPSRHSDRFGHGGFDVECCAADRHEQALGGGLELPPGTRELIYWRPASAFSPASVSGSSDDAAIDRYYTALFALSTGKKRDVLPFESMQTVLDAVIDTNVLVAAFRSGVGASHRFLLALEQRHWRPVISPALALEYESALKRGLHGSGLSLTDIDDFVQYLCSPDRFVQIYFRWRNELLRWRLPPVRVADGSIT